MRRLITTTQHRLVRDCLEHIHTHVRNGDPDLHFALTLVLCWADATPGLSKRERALVRRIRRHRMRCVASTPVTATTLATLVPLVYLVRRRAAASGRPHPRLGCVRRLAPAMDHRWFLVSRATDHTRLDEAIAMCAALWCSNMLRDVTSYRPPAHAETTVRRFLDAWRATYDDVRPPLTTDTARAVHFVFYLVMAHGHWGLRRIRRTALQPERRLVRRLLSEPTVLADPDNLIVAELLLVARRLRNRPGCASVDTTAVQNALRRIEDEWRRRCAGTTAADYRYSLYMAVNLLHLAQYRTP